MVDYSKWKDIEISDDEDDTHPNIDTPSLFRWRHQARVERMEEVERSRRDFEREKETHQKRLKEVKDKLQNCKEDELPALQKLLEELEVKGKKITDKEDELRVKEKKTPWNVDTISKPAFSKTIINKTATNPSYDELSDEEKEKRMCTFVKNNEKLLKQFGMLKKYEDSKKFLLDHNQLVCEATANYLVIWCINLEMEKKSELMAHVAHQCICMQFILELAKQLDVDPRACVGSFFQRIQIAEPEYKAHFSSEVVAFKDRIRKRAEEKIDEAIAEQEEEERKARLGPGGLDPVEVFENLPDCLKQCFESKDIDLLKKTIAELPEEEARYHMKRCVDSGMWVPDASEVTPDATEATTEATTDAATVAPGAEKAGADTEDEIYEDASSLSPSK